MANNNGLNVLDAIIAAKFGKGTGGSGGVTKEYVDTQVGAVSERVDDVESVIPSTATPQNPLATSSDVSGTAITTTSTTSPLSTANGKPRAITIYGKSEIVDGAIKSAGEGWSVVDLGTVTWNYDTTYQRFYTNSISTTIKIPASTGTIANIITPKYTPTSIDYLIYTTPLLNNIIAVGNSGDISVRDTNYTNPTDFANSLSGVLLCYELADPTQGNTIAIKTDDGSGIDGTMATFSTGTPLYGVSDTIRDVMEWNGSSGEVTKNCAKVKLADLTWGYNTNYNHPFFMATLSIPTQDIQRSILSSNYIEKLIFNDMVNTNQSYSIVNNTIRIRDDNYTTVSDFVASLSDAELVYKRATPTTEQLTQTENASIAGLRTFAPTTHVQNNAQADMTLEAYAGTANGQAVADLEEKVQKQIDGKITVSSTLTLAANAWSNNTQTVTFAHDTTKRNVIDITPSEVPAWAAAGVYASAETSTGITFACATVPETALTFKVTSMEVS